MSGVEPRDNGARRPTGAAPEPGASRRAMLVLPLLLMGMWLWKSYAEGPAQPPVAYSQLYQWIEQGKVESVVLDGEVVAATLKNPEPLDGRQVKDLQTNV